MRRTFITAGLLLATLCFGQTQWVRPGYYKEITPARWKDRVDQMLRRDAATPPASEGVMFVGSATIAGWDLKQYFAEYNPINRGIGGSLISESTFYTDQLVVPFKPSTIVFYSGDNDTAYGMTPAMVAEDFSKFLAKIHSSLPSTQLVVFAIRPSIARLAVWDVVVESNKLMKAIAARDKQVQFVDLTAMLLGADGQPKRELLGEDLHHLNKDGYDLVSPIIKAAIVEAESNYMSTRARPVPKVDLPAGPGKDVVERVCSSCHALYTLTQRSRGEKAWESTVGTMIDRGAKVSDADFKAVVEYLSTHFGVAAN